MRLKRIKLAGFKSFVDTTSIPFPGEMTAIVGPNGCGKSNVIDAVRWVLGESSAKNLRGDAMTDVIFNGSTARKPVSQCSVELLFDNTSGRIQGEFANYNEIAVKRVVTREAQSTYLLNGTKCRRRDVTDLFLGTGLGPRSYAIIEQGMISRLIESKPQELRVFIEEAAGISKYKERRRETETRIRHTRENLERLEDVRSELATQLDKLQRQASAAQRYTDLKKAERKLKGELSGIRWLAHDQRLSLLRQQIIESETACEALIAKQRGDELGLVGYKQQISSLNHTIEDLQQQLFKVSGEITRIEQSQKYATQRTQQLNAEIEEVNQQLSEFKDIQNIAEQQANDTQLTLAAIEPERYMLNEQIESALEERHLAESSLTEFAQRFRAQEQQYNQLKQQAQSCHSQIQSTMQMQMRTQQRITDIEQDLSSLEREPLSAQLSELKAELEVVELQYDEVEDRLSAQRHQLVELNNQFTEVNEKLQLKRGQQQRTEAECSALQALQNDQAASAESRKAFKSLLQLWQVLTVKSGFESLVDIAIQHLQHQYAIENIEAISSEWLATKGNSFALIQRWQSDKRLGTLAEVITNERVPEYFNRIYIADDYASGIAMLSDLGRTDSVVTRDGKWLSHEWIMTAANQMQGKTLRQAKISELELLTESLFGEVSAIEADLHELQSKMTQANDLVKQSESALQQSEQSKFQHQSRMSLLQMQLEQADLRQQQLNTECNEQKLQLANEHQQLEQLSAQVANIEDQLLSFESEQISYEAAREKHEQHVHETRQQVEYLTRQKHEKEIVEQQLKGQFESASERLKSSSQQLQKAQQRFDKLSQELHQINAPEADTKATIELLISQREEIVATKLVNTEELAGIQQLVNEAEKDQQGLASELEKQREMLESLKLESQGYQVRSDAVLEQLSEINQSLKDVLERLPENAEETTWQADLEKTQAAIGRLGAVNLAAVDEYKSQAERKQHLDIQFDDLQSALNTLEDAIRKIDKETKIRFSRTFEQVNDDLKSLFPKVFGGGSAYLALTEDDLLETGVTIMARPPGKKNSTIHLLSGGEKALTALSLVFAIFRLNPAPFCLLDEVDAPLDDANVERFCRLVSEMSKTVQFIYITHNKIAMEMAEHLTGVTMSEPGVSRMVTVDVDEAVAIANA